MSWFDTTGFATLAKSALNSAQKTIDRALDIKDDVKLQPKPTAIDNVKSDESFFTSFGLGEPKNSKSELAEKKVEAVTQSPTKSAEEPPTQITQSGIWGDWGTSFYNLTQQLPVPAPKSVAVRPETQAETFQPHATSLLPSSPTVEDQDTVFQQPHREHLFPDEDNVHQPSIPPLEVTPEMSEEKSAGSSSNSKEFGRKRSAPLKLQPRRNKSSKHSDTKEQLATGETSVQKDTTSPDSALTVSVMLAELSPEALVVQNEMENAQRGEDSKPTDAPPSCIDFQGSNNTSTSSNESAETLCEDDDEDETEEELTVMERKPQSTKELFLDLSSPCVPDNEASSTDYCVIEQGSNQELTINQGSYSEPSISCSTSMEVILEAEVMGDVHEAVGSHLDTADDEMSQEREVPSQVSSPDSVVPIYEEPPSNLASPHFPDIHIIPSGTSYIAVSLDLISDQNMCDSDITILSPSVGESTDSESCDNKHDVDSAEPKEVRDCETSSSGSKVSHTSSSGSFVNCSLDDADQCEMQREHSNSSNNNSERSSDPMGKDTETSGHTSGDDIETTTSSDIEIISPPSCDNGDRNSSPLKHMFVPRLHKMRPTADSPSLVEFNKDSFTMPIVLESDEAKGNIYEGSLETLHCRVRNDFPETEALMTRIGALEEVLSARERRVLELSKENADMLEVNARMKSRVERLEETQSKDSEDVSKLTREFSQRLSQLEGRLHETEKERDTSMEELEKLREEFSKSVSGEEMAALLSEKNTQIAELMQEGEKLSKQQLNLSTIIKKLRIKEKETESTLKSQKEKIDDETKELERLRKSLGAKDDQEKKHIDAIRQLTTSVHRLEDEKTLLKNELEDVNTKMSSMKNNMDRAYKEMTDVQKKLSEKDREIQEASMSAEMSVKENLQHHLKGMQEQWNQEKETLQVQTTQLRLTLARAEEQAHLREEALRADIASLQQRLRETDMKNDELNQDISSATRPLLRQIENLQSIHSSQAVAWEKLEKSLTISLQESQRETTAAQDELAQMTEKLGSSRTQLSNSEAVTRTLSQEKVQLASQLEVLKAKLVLLEENKLRESSSLETLKQNFAEEVTTLKKEKENALREVLLLKEELEKRKTEHLDETLEQGASLNCPSGRSSPTLSVTLSHHSSVSESMRGWAQEQGSESSFDVGNRSAMYEAWWGGSASSMIENLQSQVKLRQGEVYQLQSEINRLDKVRESVTDDLGTMARRNEDLQLELQELEQVRQSFLEMEQKYNTLLQMYGEKVEESEELKLDLSDVKTMYRAQIEELLRKSS